MARARALRLRREPDNAHDSNAIAVDSCRGVCIGYIGRDDALFLAPALDADRPHEAVIHELRGGLGSAPHYGCRVEISWDGRSCGPAKELDSAQKRARAGKLAIGGRERDERGRLVPQSRTGCFLALLLPLAGAILAGVLLL